jgi:hypothetical protein
VYDIVLVIIAVLGLLVPAALRFAGRITWTPVIAAWLCTLGVVIVGHWELSYSDQRQGEKFITKPSDEPSKPH